MARLADASALDRDCGRNLDGNLGFFTPAKDCQRTGSISEAIVHIDSIHTLEGWEPLAALYTAMTVGLWALLLSVFAGPPWLANVFFALALLLLLVWTPGAVPDQGV